MSYQMQLTVANAPAMLERILQTVRVRGFIVTGLELTLNSQDGRYRIHLQLDGSRPLPLLERQLAKLVGVEQVSGLSLAASGQPAVAALA